MIVDLTEDVETGVLELTIDGSVSRQEFEDIIGAVERLLASHPRINLLEKVDEIGWVEPESWWHECTSRLACANFVNRIAVVSGRGQVGPVARAFAGFFPAEIRVFRREEAGQAKIWLTGSAGRVSASRDWFRQSSGVVSH